MDDGCIFCDIIEGRREAFRIYEDEEIFACLDKFPITRGHTLVMPKLHVARLTDLPARLTGRMMEVSCAVARSMYTMHSTAINFLINEGEDAGQIIFHVHCHVVPRYGNTGQNFRMNRMQLSKDEMENIRQTISMNMHE